MSHHRSFFRLVVTAECDSAFLAKLTGLLACLNLVPSSLHTRIDGQGADLRIRTALCLEAPAQTVSLLQRKVLQMPVVRTVEYRAAAPWLPAT